MRSRHRQHEHPDESADGTLPLTALHVGEAGTVREVRLHDHLAARKLLALGVVPGVHVKVIQRFPAYVLQIGYTQIAIDHHLAKAVRIEPDTEV
ncbi:MAG: FeoA family protein [Armatimonadota bacterium]|nr:ferrous iron transport protein A [bacterium]MDW8319852.1 FeoA family protein [Armatimonadota bacterium]